jgi:hypothetical protein
LLYAGAGLFRITMLGAQPHYLTNYFPSMILSGLGVAFVFPQLSSLVAQALPPGRTGVGGAALQAGRQFGGTFGVALTIALLGDGGAGALARFDRVWWVIVVGGVATTLLVLPTRSVPTTAAVVVPESAPVP